MKHIRFLPLFAALGLALSGCGRTAAAPAVVTTQTEPQLLTETTEPDTAWLTQLSPTETDTAEACDVALPMERPQTTEAEETSDEETMTAPSTTAPTTVVPSTTAPTTTAPSTTKPTTTAPSTTKPTTTKAATTAAAAKSAVKTQEAVSGTAQAILNRAVLHPQKTNDAELDDAVQKIFSDIFTSGMSTYDKVLACYTYIIRHAEYGRTPMTVTQSDLKAYQSEQEAWNVLFAKRILNTGKGVCDDYASLFLVMTRAIGLDCYYTHGYTTNTKGETKDHVWDTITVDGVDYIFDAQVEDKQSANGIQLTFFCRPYTSSIAKIYSGYDLAADKAAYQAFRK